MAEKTIVSTMVKEHWAVTDGSPKRNKAHFLYTEHIGVLELGRQPQCIWSAERK